MNKLAVAVILYKPESIGLEVVRKNIESYADFIYTQVRGGVYIIDNTPASNSVREECFKKIPGAFYYHNKNDGGIAGAQNYACKKALEDGFEWIMTMDQDSSFDEKNLSEYIKLFSEYSEKDSKAKSFTLRVHRIDRDILSLPEIVRFKILSPIKRKLLRLDSSKMPVPGSEFYNGPAIDYPELFIPASTNIISLSVWQKLGGFDESLFIDQVDNDFSIRLTDSGYKIVRFNDIVFSHKLGEKKFTIMTKHQPHYDSFRLYYIFRNHLVMLKRYPKHRDAYSHQLKWFIVENLVFSWAALKNILIFIRAYKDYKEMTGLKF